MKADLYKKLKDPLSENSVYVQYADALMQGAEKLVKTLNGEGTVENRNWFMAENDIMKAIGLFQNHGAPEKAVNAQKRLAEIQKAAIKYILILYSGRHGARRRETQAGDFRRYQRVEGYRVARKVEDLLKSIKMMAYAEDIPLCYDRIHMTNGTRYLDGYFSEDKEYCRNRLDVAYTEALFARTE